MFSISVESIHLFALLAVCLDARHSNPLALLHSHNDITVIPDLELHCENHRTSPLVDNWNSGVLIMSKYYSPHDKRKNEAVCCP